MNNQQLINIYSSTDIYEILLFKTFLEYHGIQVFIYDQFMGGINFQYAFAVGGIKLFVCYKNKLKCHKLLEIFLKNPKYIKSNNDIKKLCPKCNSKSIIGYKDKLSILNSLSLLFLSFPMFIPTIGYHCIKCKNAWDFPINRLLRIFNIFIYSIILIACIIMIYYLLIYGV